MEYPLISEYRDAIMAPEDNFNELASLRPVLDGHGDPVMSSGNFAVVFKMRDEGDGKLYAVKCFIKDQEGRDESYRKIVNVKKYKIKQGTKVVCDGAFLDCKTLQSVIIPDSVTSIGESAFSWCKSLQSVSIPNSVTLIGESTFSYCTSLQNLTLPKSLTYIVDKAFSWCLSLRSVIIPDSVASIGDRAFSACTSLQSANLPTSIISISNNAFPLSCKIIRR